MYIINKYKKLAKIHLAKNTAISKQKTEEISNDVFLEASELMYKI